MSMFDKETQLKNATEFDAAQGCRIFKGEFVGMVDSAKYRTNAKAKVLAGPIDSAESDAKEYIVFGVLAEQVSRIDSNDLPANVKIGQDGDAKVFVKLG